MVTTNEGEVAARGVTVLLRDKFAAPLEYAEGRKMAGQADAVAKQANPEARAVYQDNGLTAIVWLPPDADAHAMRRHLEAKGYRIGSVSAHYGQVMA